MQWIFIVLAIIFYIYRFTQKQKKAVEEAQRRRQQIPPSTTVTTNATTPSSTSANPPSGDQQQYKTIEEILKEMHRRVETQTKPYSKPVAPKPAAKKESPKLTSKVHQKKETATVQMENSAYRIEEEKTPASMSPDFIKKGQLTDIYNEPNKESALVKKFNVRDAVIAQVILQRPEW